MREKGASWSVNFVTSQDLRKNNSSIFILICYHMYDATHAAFGTDHL